MPLGNTVNIAYRVRVIRIPVQRDRPEVSAAEIVVRREGEQILLCWKLGEDDIRYWHGADEGFAGRKPL